jgi:ribosomal protein S25
MTKKKQEVARQQEQDKSQGKDKGKGKVKKWGTAAKEKEEHLERALTADNELLNNIKDEVSKMKLITPSAVALKYSIRISLAKQILQELTESNAIKPYFMANKLRVYTTA